MELAVGACVERAHAGLVTRRRDRTHIAADIPTAGVYGFAEKLALPVGNADVAAAMASVDEAGEPRDSDGR